MKPENTGLAAVFAAAGLSMDAKDSVSRDALNAAVTAALTQGEKLGLEKAGVDLDKAKTEATVTANTRAKAILDHAEAQGREGMARHLAFDTNMSAEAAVATMKAAPKGAASSRLGNVPDHNLSADDTNPGKEAAVSWDSVMAKKGLPLPK
ncbi:hypothetical protein FNL56_13380 [Tardiphaga sp. vice304]|uniref:hypothetical protein n=1 Tax=Tardiphaga sp. vice304 TaxID=2592817 RepID=UPI001165A9F6|nr:hypothetical protein [Tardiphaga sp. vice304]QDM26992.1 hypothetical protein FNL56_13380 [Tardiphaga sp. vice304]